MTVATLFTDIRYQMSDELKSGYTDTELIGYLNQVNEYVYTTLMNHSSNLALKSSTLTFTAGEATLPDDFSYDEALVDPSIVSAGEDIFRSSFPKLESIPPYGVVSSNTYKIVGDTIYSDNDSLTLYYYYLPDNYTATTDTLSIPAYFRNLYRQMIKFLAMNSDEFDMSVEASLMSRFEGDILEIAGKRGNTNPRAVMPFKV